MPPYPFPPSPISWGPPSLRGLSRLRRARILPIIWAQAKVTSVAGPVHISPSRLTRSCASLRISDVGVYGRGEGIGGRGRDRGAAWVSYAPLSLPVPTAPQFFMLVGPSPASGQGSLLLGGPLHAPAAGIFYA